MKKKRMCYAHGLIIAFERKIGLKMKLTLVLVLLGLTSLMASEGYSQLVRISISMENATIERVLADIEERSDYNFVYNRDVIDLERRVDVNYSDAKVSDILTDLFKSTNVEYRLVDRTIILSKVSGLQYNVQSQNVTGRVTDSSKNPLPGVTVLVKGTSKGTVTDLNGSYSLVEVSSDAILVFSFVGMKAQEVPVAGKSSINVVLAEDAIDIDEVVAIGYGSIKKSDITGSVSSVKVGEVSENPVVGVDQLLKGRSAGVYSNTMSAEPGGTTNIVIRGASSLSSSNQPLYVVDGIPFDNAMDTPDPFADRYQSPTNGLTMLNPQDIQSIEVLKDASATAIYGSRGANGVILITTKSGKKGKTSVNLSSSLTVANTIKKIGVLDGPDFARYRNEALVNSGSTPIFDGTNNPAPEDVVWTNWQNEVLRRAISQNHRLSLSSGDGDSKLFMSGGVSNNQGIIDKTEFQKVDFRVNYEKELSKRFKVTTTFALADITSKMSETNGNGGTMNRSAIRSMISKSPITTPISDYDEEDILQNSPVNWVNDYTDDGDENTMNLKLDIQYKLTDWLTYQVRSGYNYRQKERSRYYGRTIYPGIGPGGLAGYSNLKYTGIVVENMLNINKAIAKKHFFDGVLGTTFSQADNLTYSVMASSFPDDVLRASDLSLAEVYSPSHNDQIRTRLLSFLARVNYNYKWKYYLTLSCRADGSSKFSPGNKFSYFPSVATAWRLSNEPFIKDVKAISNLKLRLGWGQTGNQGLNAYATLPSYSSEQYPYGGNISSGLYVSNIKNENLKWETSQQVNLALDLGLFDNRLNITAELYNKKSKDMLIEKNLPPSAGFDRTWVNFGEIDNKGIDLSVDGIIINKKNWKISAGCNFSINKNKISELGLPESTYGYVQYWGTNVHNDGDIQSPANTFIQGKPIGLFWGYKTDGVYQTQQEIDDFVARMAQQNGTENQAFLFGAKPVPGDIIFVDNNGDGLINEQDKQIIGDPNPDFIWGFNSSISYRNFEFSFLINGVQGRDIMNANLNRETTMSGDYYNIRSSAWEGRWTGPGTSNYYPKAYLSIPYKNQVMDRWVEDGSYIRLSNITVSYTFKVKPISLIQDVRLFMTGTNLLTITNYSGFDPEVDSFSGDPLRIGIDNNSYPNAKTLVCGLSVNF